MIGVRDLRQIKARRADLARNGSARMIDAASPEAGAVPGERYSVFIVPSENQEKSFYHAIRAIDPPTEGTSRPGDVPGAYSKALGTVNWACEGGGQT